MTQIPEFHTPREFFIFVSGFLSTGEFSGSVAAEFLKAWKQSKFKDIELEVVLEDLSTQSWNFKESFEFFKKIVSDRLECNTNAD